MKPIRVAAVQMTSAIGNISANAKAMRGWIERAADAGAAIAAFPECCLTGYRSKEPAEIAIPIDDEAALSLERFAAKRGLAIGYGLIESRPDASTRPRIAYIVADDGTRLVYRKTHLGAIEDAFEAGNEIPVAKIAGVRIGVQLCWESHLPELSTIQRAQGAELILAPYACGLGGPGRIEKWDRYLAARAFDNGLFVVACNALRRAIDSGVRGGGVAAYAPDGSRIGCCDSLEDDICLFEIGGTLPREKEPDGMRGIDYFARRRPELYLNTAASAPTGCQP